MREIAYKKLSLKKESLRRLQGFPQVKPAPGAPTTLTHGRHPTLSSQCRF
jgi:hypothetical protein